MVLSSNCVVSGLMEIATSTSLTEEQRDNIYAYTSLRTTTRMESVANWWLTIYQ